MSSIKILLGDREIGKHDIEKENILVGRAPEVDVFIPNLAVSRKHGRIFKKNGKWFYEDLCSTNGTYSGYSKISLCQLVTGSELVIGKCRIIFIENNQPSKNSQPQHSIDWKKILCEEEKETQSNKKLDETIKFDKTAIIKLKQTREEKKKEEQLNPIAYIELQDRKERVNITEKEMYIGKDQDCKIRINGLLIGSKHAKIEFDGETIKVVALKSFPTVSVNGQKIKERILKKDDYIDIGSYRLRIRFL